MKPTLYSLFTAALVMCNIHMAVAQKKSDQLLCMGAYWTQAEAYDFLEKAHDEWNTKEEWEKRATTIRNGIIEGMMLDRMPSERGPVDHVIINQTREMDGYIVENIAIESFPGFYVTGNLYRPVVSDSKKKYAGVLCPHGHWRTKDNYGRFRNNVQRRCAAFARMGAVVFAYDMLGFGESTQVTHEIPYALLLQTWNSKRIVDYLQSRKDVDPERIGITGASGGATQAFILAAIDERIKASIPAVQVSAHFFGGCGCESGMPIHKSKNHQTNNVEIAACIAPRALLLLSDGSDWTRNTPYVEFPYIFDVYKTMGVPYQCAYAHFPGQAHDYAFDKRSVAYNFMGTKLGMSIAALPYNFGIDDGSAGGFDESFVTILPENQLYVFTEESPRPSSLLDGNKEVMDFLKNEFMEK